MVAEVSAHRHTPEWQHTDFPFPYTDFTCSELHSSNFIWRSGLHGFDDGARQKRSNNKKAIMLCKQVNYEKIIAQQ